MVRHTLKVLQHLLQVFKSVSDHFGTLCIKGLKETDLQFVGTKAHLKQHDAYKKLVYYYYYIIITIIIIIIIVIIIIIAVVVVVVVVNIIIVNYCYYYQTTH